MGQGRGRGKGGARGRRGVNEGLDGVRQRM